MKALPIKFLSIFGILFLSLTTFGGVGDGAGGGGGNISLTSGFTPEAFSATAFGEKDGVLGTVLKYYLLAGAKKSESPVMINYVVEGQEADSAFIQSKQADPSQYYQLNFLVKYEDLVNIRSGVSADASGTSITFKGILAEDLYSAMDHSGLTRDGWTLDNNQQVLGNIYHDGLLNCEKRDRATCTLLFLSQTTN